MSRLTIVISAVGSIERLEGTLVSVLENRPADCEVLVAHQGPYADPYDLKGEVRFVQSSAGASPIQCVNQALLAARAPFVHLLSSGCQVTEGWTDEALSRFGDRLVGAVAPLVLDANLPERIFAAGLGYRRGGQRYLIGRGQTQLAPEAQASLRGACGFAAFYRKSALEMAGGLSPRLGPQQADLDLALALAAAGFSIALEPRSRVLAPAEVEGPQGARRKSMYDERLFWRNLPGTGRTGTIAAHAGLVALELLSSFPRPRMFAQLAGRILACCQPSCYTSDRKIAQSHPRSSGAKRESLRVDRSHSGQALADGIDSRVHSS